MHIVALGIPQRKFNSTNNKDVRVIFQGPPGVDPGGHLTSTIPSAKKRTATLVVAISPAANDRGIHRSC